MNGRIRMKDWKHLIFEQRKVILNGISHKYKLKEIAETLGYDSTSIFKEVKRNRKNITIGLNTTDCKKLLDGLMFVLVVIKGITINAVLPNINMMLV